MGIEELKPEEFILNELMREYQQIVHEMETDLHDLNEKIEELTDIRDLSTKPHQDKLIDIEAKMRIPMLERKATFICSFGKINFRKGAVRRTYNADALDSICAADEYVKKLIWAHRKETIGEPSITVKLAKEE